MKKCIKYFFNGFCPPNGDFVAFRNYVLPSESIGNFLILINFFLDLLA